MLLLFLLQAATTPPDIELKAVVDARSVRIEKKGEASLEAEAAPDAGSGVHVEAPRADGAATLRNVRVTVDAEARIADPRASETNVRAREETTTPN